MAHPVLVAGHTIGGVSGLRKRWALVSDALAAIRMLAVVERFTEQTRKEASMRHVRRIALALASIAALAMAGGAHWRAG